MEDRFDFTELIAFMHNNVGTYRFSSLGYSREKNCYLFRVRIQKLGLWVIDIPFLGDKIWKQKDMDFIKNWWEEKLKQNKSIIKTLIHYA